MIRVFLAEDEYVIRKGILNSIDWNQHGYEMVGDAGDGETALEKIRETKPDIVITDIRMPFMDGLTLARHIKEELPDTQIIVLSGYDEFEYARQGISIGVSAYLLKPISGEALIRELDTVAGKREKEKKTKSAAEREEYDSFLHKLSELSSSFEKAGMAVVDHYLKKGAGEEEEKELVVEYINLDIKNRELIRKFLTDGTGKETEDFVDSLFDKLGEKAMDSLLYRQYIVMDAYLVMAEFAEKLGESRSIVEVFDTQDSANLTKTAVKEYLVKNLGKVITLREEIASDRYRDVVKNAMDYVKEHYAEEGLSLQDVAGHVNVSPNHFSMIFSQKTGSTFIRYLTDVRMEKARELLRCTSLRTAEICYQIGYRDPHYFSALFKKTQGMTPTEFRGGKTLEDEE